jgi:hypothetical protein
MAQVKTFEQRAREIVEDKGWFIPHGEREED